MVNKDLKLIMRFGGSCGEWLWLIERAEDGKWVIIPGAEGTSRIPNKAFMDAHTMMLELSAANDTVRQLIAELRANLNKATMPIDFEV